MSILSGSGVYKSFGVDSILEDINFHVEKGDRVGILGGNGAGKTTLLKIISGELGVDRGSINYAKNISVGYLRQTDDFSNEDTILQTAENVFSDLDEEEKMILDLSHKISNMDHESREYIEAIEKYEKCQYDFEKRGGFTYKSRIRGILSSMAFSEKDWNKKICLLSGGERTRLALGCILLEEPDILLLDEPTNHLDIGTIKWLEQYLRTYKGTVLLVSHDRYFLDRTINKIFYMENKGLKIYRGDYSFCAKERRIQREIEERHYENQQRKIAKEEELIRKYKQRGTEKLAKRAASREKRLDAMEKVAAPEKLKGKIKLNFKEAFESGKDVISAKDISKSFKSGLGKTELFNNVDIDVKKGEKICILGANGIGKTTLLKILLGQEIPDSGRVKLGHNVKIAYYDQRQELLGNGRNLIQELQDDYGLYSETELRNILGSFLFRGEDVFLPVEALSGGERARLSLLKVIMSGANLIIMDEPTNHLDIESKEVFEEAMLEFKGTAIIVSHDRYFLSKVPDKIMELSKDRFTTYLGGYDYYSEKSKEILSGKKYLEDLSETEKKMENLDTKKQREAKKEEEAKLRREKREKETLELRIVELEEEKEKIEAEMCKPEIISDHVKILKLSEALEKNKGELEKNYEKWLQ